MDKSVNSATENAKARTYKNAFARTPAKPQDPLEEILKQRVEAEEITSRLSEIQNRRIDFKVMKITPDQAREWLVKNKHQNRPLNPNHVKNLSKEMLENKWDLTGEPIIFSDKGDLLEGQHRLNACVLAGVPFISAVEFGVDERTFLTMGTGRTRTLGDVFGSKGEQNRSTLTATIGWIYRDLRGQWSSSIGPNNREGEQLLERFPEIREYVMRVSNKSHKTARLCPPSILAFCYWQFAQKDSLLADEFFDALLKGSNLNEDEPVYLLRERLLQNRHAFSKLMPYHILALIRVAWNHTRAGKKVKQLLWRPNQQEFPPVN